MQRRKENLKTQAQNKESAKIILIRELRKDQRGNNEKKMLFALLEK